MIKYYKREELKKECNGYPIFKMLDDSFYMYKSNDNNYWCDTYLPNNIVRCDFVCSEVRFTLVDNKFVNSSDEMNRVHPEELDLDSNTWKKNLHDFISCVDNQELVSDILKNNYTPKSIVKKSTKSIVTPFTSIETTATTKQASTETKLKRRTITTKKTKNNIVDDMKSMSMFNIHVAKHLNKKNKILNENTTKILIATTTQAILNSTRREQETTKHANSSNNDMIKKTEKKSLINSCSVIEYQIYDESKLTFKQSLPIQYGFNCKGFPVYKTSNNVYLFRNIFGDWCHERLNNFLSDMRCLHRCTQKRLLPAGILSPIQANSVEIYQQKAQNITIVKNQRFICSSLFDCSASGCLNGGTCLKPVNGSLEFNCLCKSQFTGILCDIPLDTCYSNPCLNNSTCISKPYEEAKCNCVAGYYGKRCENYHNPCLTSDQTCLNGGTCVPQGVNASDYYCYCTTFFVGRQCELEALSTCQGQPEGKLFPHPSIKTSFVLCSENGNYNIQVCPIGLVYNTFLQRCDYNNDEPDLSNPCKQNPCKNSAKCTQVTSSNNFTCSCNPGFTGQLCETNVDECDNANCGDGSTCIDLINGYVCLCPSNYYGSDCKTNSKFY